MDLSRKVVVICQAKTRHTKTSPLTFRALEILKAKPKLRHPHTSLVFPSKSSTRISNRNLERAFGSAMKKAKVTDLHFHDPRYTFASRLAMAGKDLYLIQKLLGHRDPHMVQRYAQHSIDSPQSGIEVLENFKQEAGKNDMSQIQPQSPCQETSTHIALDEKSKKSYSYTLSAHSSDG